MQATPGDKAVIVTLPFATVTSPVELRVGAV
jgi:hypothetical protein